MFVLPMILCQESDTISYKHTVMLCLYTVGVTKICVTSKPTLAGWMYSTVLVHLHNSEVRHILATKVQPCNTLTRQ